MFKIAFSCLTSNNGMTYLVDSHNKPKITDQSPFCNYSNHCAAEIALVDIIIDYIGFSALSPTPAN
uniref:Uncharacterized protein n=1 Tax=Anguilla anguilla TaxID=7936 RepID=A0A0E9PD87_ANGAN